MRILEAIGRLAHAFWWSIAVVISERKFEAYADRAAGSDASIAAGPGRWGSVILAGILGFLLCMIVAFAVFAVRAERLLHTGIATSAWVDTSRTERRCYKNGCTDMQLVTYSFEADGVMRRGETEAEVGALPLDLAPGREIEIRYLPHDFERNAPTAVLRGQIRAYLVAMVIPALGCLYLGLALHRLRKWRSRRSGVLSAIA